MILNLNRALPSAGIILFALLIVTPVCGALFNCGCGWPWDGLFAYCDSLRGIKPGCPWCEHPGLGLGSVIVPIAVGAASARFVRLKLKPGGRPGRVATVSLLVGMLGALAGLAGVGALTLAIPQRLLP